MQGEVRVEWRKLANLQAVVHPQAEDRVLLGRCRQVARDAKAVASDVATEVPDPDDDDDSVALSSLPSTVYQKPSQLDNAESEFDLSDEECRPLKGRTKTIADWMVTLTPSRVWQGVVASIATK